MLKQSSNLFKSYHLGIQSEKNAIDYLKSCSYVIVAHRVRTALGEIDVIAIKNNIITFFEIKYSKYAEKSIYMISDNQKNRISNAAQLWIEHFNYAKISLNYKYLDKMNKTFANSIKKALFETASLNVTFRIDTIAISSQKFNQDKLHRDNAQHSHQHDVKHHIFNKITHFQHHNVQHIQNAI